MFFAPLYLVLATFLTNKHHAYALEFVDRELPATPIADWNVTISPVSGQTITFTTGTGGGTNPNTKIHIFDKCRIEGTDGVYEGNFFPNSNVTGMIANTTLVSGTGTGGQNSMSFVFDEGIDTNLNIYTDNGNNTATVKFCVLVGLYEDNTMVNFAEVKLTYNIDLITGFASLAGTSNTQADDNAAATNALAFDGELEAYFCDGATYDAISGSQTTVQGELLYVCFKVKTGQFEVRDIKNLTIINADTQSTLSQSIIADGAIQSGTTPYAEKTCIDAGPAGDDNICVVKLLLKADFYYATLVTLTGNGHVLLEAGGRRQLRAVRFMQQDTTTDAPYEIAPVQFKTVSANNNKAASSANAVALGFGAVLGSAALLL